MVTFRDVTCKSLALQGNVCRMAPYASASLFPGWADSGCITCVCLDDLLLPRRTLIALTSCILLRFVGTLSCLPTLR
jgi:hypothetical protein